MGDKTIKIDLLADKIKKYETILKVHFSEEAFDEEQEFEKKMYIIFLRELKEIRGENKDALL